MKTLIILLASFFFTTNLAQESLWQTLELTNALTGEVFTLGGFEGQTVYVEPMATWCSNCRKQLTNVASAKEQLADNASVVFVALSVEGNLANETLAAYAQKEGFDFVFAVASPELLKALVEVFGRSVASPPSTPHFIIGPDASVSALFTGFKSAEAIVEQVTAN